MGPIEFFQKLEDEDITVSLQDIYDFIQSRVYSCEYCEKQILVEPDQAQFICWDCRQKL